MLVQNDSLHSYFPQDWFVYYLTTVYLASNEAGAEMLRSKILKHKKIRIFLESDQAVPRQSSNVVNV